jgi:hypothetical protein
MGVGYMQYHKIFTIIASKLQYARPVQFGEEESLHIGQAECYRKYDKQRMPNLTQRPVLNDIDEGFEKLANPAINKMGVYYNGL